MNTRHTTDSILPLAGATLLLALLLPQAAAQAQSSSLYVNPNPGAANQPGAQAGPQGNFGYSPDGRPRQLNPNIAAYSFSAVVLPEPRRFGVQDLITIIVRESDENTSNQSLTTDKTFDLNGSIDAFPHLRLADLLQFQLRGGNNENMPEVGMGFDTAFEGDGQTRRRDSYNARIQARVIDVKPNGTLVLEARKILQSDDESVEMILTGICRAQDVTAANTVMSTQLYDLRLIKNHTGELRKANRKGLLTKLFETIFNF